MIAPVWEERKSDGKMGKKVRKRTTFASYMHIYTLCIEYIWSTEAICICICDVRGQTKHVSIHTQMRAMNMDRKAKRQQTIDTILI